MDAGTNVHQQVIAFEIGGATSRAGTGWTIEVDVFSANTSHEVGAGFLTKAGREYGVEVVKSGTKSLVAVIQSFAFPYGDLAVEAEVILENLVGAETG